MKKTTMKAIRINGKYRAEVVNVPIPEGKEGQVIVKVDKCGICGSDAHMVIYGDDLNHGIRPGHEFSGTIVNPGKRDDLKVGDPVVSNFFNPCGKCEACKSGNIGCCPQSSSEGGLGLSKNVPGGMAEYVACFPDFVYKIPEGINFMSATLTDPLAVALHAVHLGRVTLGDKVLITGGSSIGLFVALACKKVGASLVAVTETHPKKVEEITQLFPEVDGVFDAKDPNIASRLYDYSHGGFDVCIDCCGYESAVSLGIIALKVSGRLILTGANIENISIPSVIALIKEIEIKGSMAYSEEEFVRALKRIGDSSWNVQRMITQLINIEDVGKVMNELQDHSLAAYKIIVDVAKTGRV